MNKHRLLLNITLAACLLLGPARAALAANDADTIYMGGTIYTMTETLEEAKDEAKAKTVEAVAVKDGKIVFAGPLAQAETDHKGAATVIVDLHGKSMYPGFIDAHGHFPDQGNFDLYQVNLNSPPLGKMTSIADYIAALKLKAAITPAGEWVIGWGYDDTLITEMRHPTREELDQVSTAHPIYIKHISMHMGVANTKAMEIGGVMDGSNPAYAGEVAAGNVPLDSNGKPLGLLQETKAMSMVNTNIPGLTLAQTYSYIQRAADVYAAVGVTLADNGAAFLSGNPNPGGTQDYLLFFQELNRRGQLPIRTDIHPLGRYIVPVQGTLVDASAGIRQIMGWSGAPATINGVTFGLPNAPANAPNAGSDISTYFYPVPPAGLTPGAAIPSDRIFLGSWKLIFDGSNQGYTGWFKNPGYYKEHENDGRHYHGFEALNYPPEQMAAALQLLHRNNQAVEVHGNGNAAIEQIVTAIEEAVAAAPGITDRRHTVIHSQMAERQHVERMAGLYGNLKPEYAKMYGLPLEGTLDDAYMLTGTYKDGQPNTALINSLQNGQLIKNQNLINSYYTNHTFFWGDRHRDIFMGPGRAYNMSPAGWSLHHSQPFTVHNDTPVTPMHPLRSVQSSVTRVSSNGNNIFNTGTDYDGIVKFKETDKSALQQDFWDYDQRVNRLQALKSTISYAAYQNHLENTLGSIKPGLLADFVVLEQDPLKTDGLKIASIPVATTIVGNEVVYGYLPGADNFTNRAQPGYVQASGVTVQVTDVETYSKDEAEANGLKLPSAPYLYNITKIEGTTTGANAVFQFIFFGNGQPLSSFGLSAVSTAAAPNGLTYGRPTVAEFATADAKWWVTPLAEPALTLSATDVAANKVPYVAYIMVKDNGLIDADTDIGKLLLELAMTATAVPQEPSPDQPGGDSSSGGGGSGGCSVVAGNNGQTAGIELALLAGAALVFILRRRSARNA